MTEFILPNMQASADIAMVTGYSSGAYMSTQLVIAYPEMFRGAAFFNGGLSGLNISQYMEIMKQT
jgi:predicted esterase